MMHRCPHCGNGLDWRIKLSGFTLAQQDRGRIRCSRCAAELELTPLSIATQIVLILAATAAMWPAVELMRRGEWAPILLAVALVTMISVVAVASYFLLGRWRVKRSVSILAR